MEHITLQLCCLIVLMYVMIIYYKDKRRYRQSKHLSLFGLLVHVALINIVLDWATVYALNRPEALPTVVNTVLHGAFYISIDTLIFNLFLYLLSATEGMPQGRLQRILLGIPYYINVIVVLYFLPSLEYRIGHAGGNYAAGMSADCCFLMAGVYTLMTIALVVTRWNYIQRHKRLNIINGLVIIIAVSIYQVLDPDAQISSIAALLMVLGAYLNQEDPAILQLDRYHDEMVTGFATLIESRDESTGGHVIRTTRYVELLARALRDHGLYRDVLTRDYMKSLLMAAPMHDIGKIAVPDAVLQKPGRLTTEEFAQMQQHTVQGEQIIVRSFSHMENQQYLQIARDIALYHHEKWNGKGYPNGLSGEQIPLCARIMAIADVFDAVSEDRCYRPALPLEQCFDIIAEGSGRDFDPALVELFLQLHECVQLIHDKTENGA